MLSINDKMKKYFLLFVWVYTLSGNLLIAQQTTGSHNEARHYEELYDSTADKGQYWHPESQMKPVLYWSCTDVMGNSENNTLGKKKITEGLQYHLLAQSLAGLVNRAVEEGNSKVGVWMHDPTGNLNYEISRQALHEMGISEIGKKNAVELLSQNSDPINSINTNLKNLVKGYVLTDVEENPESNIVASVASHVFNSIIVDVRDRDFFESQGYRMTYDATEKTTIDAWREFKDECNNKALVLMPVQTAQLREFAIKNNLFVINTNKQYGDPRKGNNLPLFEEILQWLEPNSPVYGWEQGVGEVSFTKRISETGNMMVPSDWSYNTTLTSLNYKERQPDQVNVFNPKSIDWTKENKKFTSFYLSDGDNIQWMMNGFSSTEYYGHPDAGNLKMSFGFPVDNLSMMAPATCQRYFDQQAENTSIVQTFGGGYNYIDNFGESKSRKELLESISKATSAHMRQHRVKVLAVMAKNVFSRESREAYQSYINANDQLEGIIALQYTPYAGGKGKIMWFKNTKGYDIPVLTIKYSIWDFGELNKPQEGSPDYIAKKLNDSSDQFNLVIIHAWSGFSSEGTTGGQIRGTGAAKLCADRLKEDIEIINIEEMIWRVRMKYRPGQTRAYLESTSSIIPNPNNH